MTSSLLSTHLQVEREYYVEGQRHSTGLAVYGSTLYVACQSLGAILAFDIPSARFLGTAAANFPDTIERLELSSC